MDSDILSTLIFIVFVGISALYISNIKKTYWWTWLGGFFFAMGASSIIFGFITGSFFSNGIFETLGQVTGIMIFIFLGLWLVSKVPKKKKKIK